MHRVVITGLGIATPVGASAEECWDSICNLRSGINRIGRFDAERFPVSCAGTIAPFSGENEVKKRLTPQTDRITRVALACASSTFADADLEAAKFDPFDIGVSISSSTGGLEFGQEQLGQLWREGWETVSPYMSFAWYYAVNTGQVSIANNLQGPSCVPISEQAGGLDSLSYSARQIIKGTPVMLAGAIDGIICPYGVAILGSARGVNRSGDPKSYRPFSGRSSGFFPGEGGALMVLESEETVRSSAYAVLSGHASAFDPEPSTGHGLRQAATEALRRARIEPGDVDLVFADAYGEKSLDDAEATVISDLFGRSGVPVTAPKTMTGRLMSGGASLDAALACLSLRNQIIPPTLFDGSSGDLHESLDIVTDSRSAHLKNVMVLARGHGGFASAAVLSRPNETAK